MKVKDGVAKVCFFLIVIVTFGPVGPVGGRYDLVWFGSGRIKTNSHCSCLFTPLCLRDLAKHYSTLHTGSGELEVNGRRDIYVWMGNGVACALFFLWYLSGLFDITINVVLDSTHLYCYHHHLR